MSFFGKKFLSYTLALVVAGLLQACGGGGGGRGGAAPPPPGSLAVTVSTGSPAAALDGVSVMVFDANTNAPAASGTTDITGKFTASSLSVGNYYVKLSKQGYDPVPASALLTPVPQAVASNLTTDYAVTMRSSTLSGTGWVGGKVSLGTTALPNVLVAIESSGVAYSAVTNSSGNYSIYNVPAASYTVKAYAQGYSFTPVAVTVSACTISPCSGDTVNLSASTANAAASVPVNFNLIAQTGVTKPSTMLVSLVHPVTLETIPGLSKTQAFQNSLSYAFTGVANGSYLVRSTFANDTIVVDPDYIVKFGEPAVTVTAGVPDPNQVQITATSAVGLVSPTNAMTSTTPFVVTTTTTPTFTWNAYSSASDYAIEVMDAETGTVVWGGFSGTGATLTKNIPVTGTSVTYAGPALVPGKVYRWRI
ncbi:MAG: carboxypeptidase-like regulatory domain-containing protein, partial [Hylemonella sp.]|nr:carboxypeptidase-like regulatory domain-containing protein [Hylemonella sp.]